MDTFENKLEKMNKDIENLQRENNNLRSNEERLRQENLNNEKQRDNFRNKYQEHKTKNSILNLKISEIEGDFKAILIEKEKETQFKIMKKVDDNNKKSEKTDTKQKVLK